MFALSSPGFAAPGWRGRRKNPSDSLTFWLEDAFFPGFSRLRIFVYFPQTLFSTPGRKIAEPGGGKRVQRVRPDRLLSKNRSFIWEFTGRFPKTGHFSLVFRVFDLSGPHPASAADPRGPPPQPLHETAIFEEKRRLA